MVKVKEKSGRTYVRWVKAKKKSKEKKFEAASLIAIEQSEKWLRIRRNMLLLQRGGQVCLAPLQLARAATRTKPSAMTRTRPAATTRAEEPKDLMAADLEALVASFQALVFEQTPSFL
jgi:hypothetical protein